MKEIKAVHAEDWMVIYGDDDDKIWEGHPIDCSQGISYVVEYLGYDYVAYEFTNEDEIDGDTPDNFGDIIGIRKY